MLRKVDSKWFPSWSPINICDRLFIIEKKTCSSPMVMVMLYFFSRTKSNLKFKYDELDYN